MANPIRSVLSKRGEHVLECKTNCPCISAGGVERGQGAGAVAVVADDWEETLKRVGGSQSDDEHGFAPQRIKRTGLGDADWLRSKVAHDPPQPPTGGIGHGNAEMHREQLVSGHPLLPAYQLIVRR
jgi:hypothetical protein